MSTISAAGQRPGKGAALPPEQRPPAIFHITHYKAGSQWIYNILRDCVPEVRIIRPTFNRGQFLEDPVRQGKVYPTLYVTRDEFESVRLPPKWRRFIIIRDLRDTLISGYFSVKVSHKDFASKPTQQLRNRLQSMSVEEGLLHMIDIWVPGSGRIQESWMNSGETLIRYEDLLEQDTEILESVLIDECELPVPRPRLRKAIENARFDRLTGGRARGEEDVTAHQRKGVAGDWHNHFTERVKDAFKEKAGHILIGTRYEADNDW